MKQVVMKQVGMKQVGMKQVGMTDSIKRALVLVQNKIE